MITQLQLLNGHHKTDLIDILIRILAPVCLGAKPNLTTTTLYGFGWLLNLPVLQFSNM